ncbi:ABC transporter C family member 8-like [Phalaenopsis equestris]|uniref:ABC transporter C family member 8-like n=1 Tax=Phalaenopsis equestris TaxID=78828 RepID=UPI0009E43604|nr:ABC transporter C family member 8-like [Phalaenopsis equestris]
MASFWSSEGWFPSMCLTESFDLGSSCTQRLLIDILNLFFLLNFMLALTIKACRRHNIINKNRRRHWDSIIISTLCVIMGVAYFSRTCWTLYNERKHIHWDQVVVLSLRGVIWVVLSISVNVHPNNWLEAILQVWWASFALFITALNVKDLVENHSLPILVIIQWIVNLLLLYYALKLIIKNKLNGKPASESLSQTLLEKENGISNLSKAGIFSRLTFTWQNPLLRLGRSKTLELNDIPSLNDEDEAIHAYNTFSTEWDLIIRSKERTRNLVLFALAKCYKKEMIIVGFYALMKSISTAVSPLILYAFVWYSRLEHKELSKGMVLVGCLLIVKLVDSLSQRHWYFDSRRYGMRMRSAVMAALYQKELRISSPGRLRHSTGEIVNYIAVDAYRLGDFPWWFHMAWSFPLQLLVSVAILFRTVGKGALPGIIPLVIFGFINIPVAKILQHFQSQFMVAQDERLRATSEVLNSMKIIKLQSWEENFRKKIEALRGVEFKWLRKIQLTKSCGAALYWISPTVVSGVIFAGTAIMRSAPLNAGTIFTVLATLRVMSEPVRMLPEVLSVLIQAKVSLDRIDSFLLEDEIKEDREKKIHLEHLNLVAEIKNGIFSWEQSSIAPTLININLQIAKGQKISVCGSVGSGKSSLLYALLGEISKITGSVYLNGTTAYVSQTSWIQSGTLRDNILYGKPMNKKAYQNAIRCCALDKDIENFDHGDLAEIGQRGLNLSGGQKQRIQLARAVYNDADIYLLDDPFSAVDAHTASTLFHDCVMTALENKTVILVTHQVEFLPQTDRILVMEGGKIIQTGRYEDLLKPGTAFERLVTAHQFSITTINSSDDENRKTTSAEVHLQVNRLLPMKQNSEGEISVTSLSAVQLTEEEGMEIGNAGLKPYKDYIQISKGLFLFALIITFQSVFILLQGLSNYWLAAVVQIPHKSDAMLVGVFSAISTVGCVFLSVRSVLTALLGLRASKEFFSGFMDSVFKAPMAFFDSTPLGRILTRASSDLSIVDFDIPYSISFVLIGAIEVVTTTVIIATVTWQVLLVAVPALIITVWVQNYYLASARELVRINGTTKAPVMNFAGESLLGAVTIRAFGAVERFFHTNLKLIDTDAKLFFHTVAAMEWVLLRVEALQTLTVLTSTVFLVLLPQGTIAPGFSGLCLSYALTLSSAQVFLTRWYSNIENYVISVERIKQFMHIPSEPPAIIYENRPSPSWPHQGRIDLQNLKIKYRPTAPFVLKGITCTLKEGYKVGVVGRTGSGKTTLISALFRLVEPSSGSILIDNLNICSIGLKDLRIKLSIIPQEPTLFRGSVRSNLDPLGMHNDFEIWEALEKCQLKSTISKLPNLLDSTVSDDGENWSIGQRQLFCLGRVVLRKNKILVLDEATASIDSATDAILQKVIRKEFSNCTVITIAHRVPTVIDSDMVMVLSYGKIVEYDRPSNLMEMKDSDFAKLVAEYWLNCQGNTASMNNL